MIPKPIADVVEADLQALIDARVAESKTIEYKRELPDGSDRGKVHFLRSLTAFMNTNGGDLIYGIAAKDGVADALMPMILPSRDEVLLHLGDLCVSGADPRLTGVQFQWVDLAAGGCALVVRAPQSWNAPHRVTTGGHSHFYGRNAAGVSPLDVTELRRAFTLSTHTSERIRAFRAERLLALSSGQAPVQLQAGALSVLHAVPLQAFVSESHVDLRSRHAIQIHPLGSSGHNDRLNLDGRLAYRSDRDGRSYGYAQLFRNGSIEAVDVHAEYDGKKYISSYAYEEEILTALGSYLPALQAMDVQPPVYIFFSLLGVKGYSLGVSRSRFIGEDNRADRDVMTFPDAVVTDWTDKPTQLMRPVFDTVWNAFGFLRSFNYNDAGEWEASR